MSLEKDLKENSSFIGEAIFLLVIMGSFISLFTYDDIITHDYYALPLGETCYTGNHNPTCIPIQNLHNCPVGGDECIEAKYAQMVQINAFVLAGIMIFMKIGLAVLFKRKLSANRYVRIFQALIWGACPLILLWTGWEDFLYYVSRNMSIPNNMSWMNKSGLFPFVDHVLQIQNATSTSLYIVMSIGFIMVSVMLYGNMRMTKNAGFKTPI